ncbi:CoA ester lyase [Azospirillum brasilense]|nr:CoA ester lyase [Azospirillum brasilense]
MDDLGWRSVLFVPASRPDRFDKALAAGADAVCVDLEDAVAPAHKQDARAAAMRFLAEGGGGGPDRVIRINTPRSVAGMRDALALIEAHPSGGAVVVPKIDSPEEVGWVDQLLTEAGLDLRLVAQIETLRGVDQAAAITAASRRVSAVMFGGLDLAAELGVPASWDGLLHGRSRVVHAAARAGIPAIDMPFVDVRDAEGCRAEAQRALSLGFTAKMAIHPGQVPTINEAYTPTPDEVADAERIVAAWKDAPDGVIQLDGKMVERPIVLAMRRMLARARAPERASTPTRHGDAA